MRTYNKNMTYSMCMGPQIRNVCMHVCMYAKNVKISMTKNRKSILGKHENGALAPKNQHREVSMFAGF